MIMVSPEELKSLIYKGDVSELADAMSGLSSAERSKLSKAVSEVNKELDEIGNDLSAFTVGKFLQNFDPEIELPDDDEAEDLKRKHRAALRTLRIAKVACHSISTLKKQMRFLYDPWNRDEEDDTELEEAVFKVLSDRDFDWVNKLVEECLTPDSNDWRTMDWPFVNRLVCDGTCEKPEGENYIIELASSVAHAVEHSGEQGRENVYQALLSAPDFLETDVYLIFDYDSYAFGVYWSCWPQFFKRLSDEGKIDRGKLIQCAIRAASSPWRQTATSDLLKFINTLQIKPEEWKFNLDDVSSLLSSPVSVAITFALNRFKELYQAGVIDVVQLLDAIPVVFEFPKKGQSKSALTLIAQVAKKHEATVPLAINATIPALDHPTLEIQEKALDMLDGWIDRAHYDHAVAIGDRIDQLPASIKKRAKQLADSIANNHLDQSEPDDIDGGDLQSAVDLKALRRSADELENRWRSLVGVDELFATFDQPDFPKPLDFSFIDVPVLSSLEAIEPIKNHMELIDAIAQAIEVVDDPMDVERILDGILRLGPIPENLKNAASPIGARLYKKSPTETSKGIVTALDCGNTDALLGTFLNVPKPKFTDPDRKYMEGRKANTPESAFFIQRLKEFIALFNSNQFGPLLSAPTHERGWISPVVFAQRLSERIKSNLEIGEIDFLLALLRLAPDHRSAALKQLPKKNSHWVKLARIACNGSLNKLDPAEIDPVHLNVAAHVRTKQISEKEIERLGLDFKTINCKPPVYVKKFIPGDKRNPVEEKLSRNPFSAHPALKRAYYTGRLLLVAFSAWRAKMNAWNTKISNDHYLVMAATNIAGQSGGDCRVSEPVFAFVEELFEPDKPWKPIAHYAAASALFGKTNDIKIQAMDALVEACTDGRADPDMFGDAAALSVVSWVGNCRLFAISLAEFAPISPLHCWFATRACDKVIAGFDKPPNGAAHILEFYLNGLIELGLAPPIAVINACNKIKGSSKAAKLAKRILEVKGTEQSHFRDEAKMIAIQSRIDRGLRWQTNPRG